MGYFSELDIELQNREAEERGVDIELIEEEREFDWQAEQAADEEAELGLEELRHIEAQAEIQENIHNGYGE